MKVVCWFRFWRLSPEKARKLIRIEAVIKSTRNRNSVWSAADRTKKLLRFGTNKFVGCGFLHAFTFLPQAVASPRLLSVRVLIWCWVCNWTALQRNFSCPNIEIYVVWLICHFSNFLKFLATICAPMTTNGKSYQIIALTFAMHVAPCQDLIKLCADLDFPSVSLCQTIVMLCQISFSVQTFARRVLLIFSNFDFHTLPRE